MALIKCPECGREVSDKASLCPHCGCPISKVVAKKADKTYQVDLLPEEKDILNVARKADRRNSKVAGAFTWLFAIVSIAFLILLILKSNDSDFFVASIVLVTLGFSGFLICLTFYLVLNRPTSYKVEMHNDIRMFVYRTGVKPVVWVQGSKAEVFVKEHGENSTKEYIVDLPSGETASIFVSFGKIHIEYHDAEVASSNTTVINNIFQTNVSSHKKAERSDMEKILIKNAKIDALASIDPTNTEKSKEQIKIVKELDDLD